MSARCSTSSQPWCWGVNGATVTAKNDSLWRYRRPSNGKRHTRVATTGPSCPGSRRRPVSSSTSRTAPSWIDSPSFSPPPGVNHQAPSSGRPGSHPCWSSTRPSAKRTTRAACRSITTRARYRPAAVSDDGRGQRVGHEDDHGTEDDECHRRGPRDPTAGGQALLAEDQQRDDDHRGDVHDAEGQEDDEEQPAAPEAVGTVQHAHLDRARLPVPPGRHEERHRGPALGQADVLKGGELVD